ncbi:MAG: murein L,D-transpeptidase YcbB/YkuD [Arenicella sp.]|jgi:murein L,D-transpeptidase YcbB/YkuD
MKHYIINILNLALFVSLVSCGGNSRELSEEEVAVSEELKTKFSGVNELIYESDTLLAATDVLDYYKKRDFTPVWITKTGFTESGDIMFDLVHNSRDHGLMPEMFHFEQLTKASESEILDAEVILSNAFMLFITHVDVGCIDTTDMSYVWKRDLIDFDLAEELDRVAKGESPVDIIKEHQPDFWEYEQLQVGLAKFLDEYELDSNHYDIPAFKEDSVICYAEAHKALMGHNFIDSTITNQDSAFIEKLKEFQKVNGLLDDAIVGKWTGRALNKSNDDRFFSAALCLEKWRWKEAYPETYVRVNVPEFTLYFVDSNEVKRKHRVVVGAYATQTPEFQATLKTMVTNPFWHVPYSIASTEILSGARKDTAYFGKRGYKIFQNGDQVDPKTVNWSDVGQNSFRYKVRQDGGGGNSLGRIKFLFPNPNFVFIHDTPSKRLFKNDVRAYSHGCVRLHQPFDLAKAILIADGHKVQGDTLDSLVRRGNQRVLELNDPFEVYIEYFTATGDSSGNVIFHPDIYGRDEKFINNTFRKFN